jgi:predicted permease
MRVWDQLRLWFRANFWRKRTEREMDAELRFHMEAYAEDLLQRGVDGREVLRRARAEFGGVEKAKDECREARGVSVIDGLLQDLRYGLRTLGKSPGFAAVAILTLALGTGANTAVFSLLHGLTWRKLPVAHPERLVRFGAQSGEDPYVALSTPMFEEFARRQTIFSKTFAWWGDGVFSIESNGVLSRADVFAVSADYYSGFGALPEIGRLIGPEDANLRAASASLIAVLGYSFWQRRYGGDPAVLGQTIKIEGVPFTIVGVTRKRFGGISAEDLPELTVPLPAAVLIEGGTNADLPKSLQPTTNRVLEAAGRLRPGMTLDQARAQLESLWPSIRADVMPTNLSEAERTFFSALHLKVESGATGASFLRKRFAPALTVLLAIAALVLLVACLNMASLTLARAGSRSHEISVRVALGASRIRLIRQALTESLLVAMAGSAVGLALAYWGSGALAAFVIRETYIVPAAMALTPDLRILAFSAGVAVLTGLLVGLAPACRATRVDPQAALQNSARVSGLGSGALNRALIVTQVALSVVLVAGAGLFVRSLLKLQRADVGFRVESLLSFGLVPKPGGYKNLDMISYYRELTDRVSQVPGVLSAGMVHNLPGGTLEWTERVRAKEAKREGLQADFEMAMPGFFDTAGIHLLRGRTFNWQDDDHRRKVAVVSASFVREFLGGESLGQHLDVTTIPKWENLEIVGVVSDASLYDARKHAPPTVYLPTAQYGDYMGWSEMLVAGAEGESLVSQVRQAVDALGHEYVTDVMPVSQNISRALLRERVTALLSGFFGGLALLLAAIGVYGLMAYAVSSRVREIGLRVALGAQRNDVRRLVLNEALALAALGIAVGLVAAWAGSHLIAGMLYGVSGGDPVTLASVAGVLLFVAAGAAWIPARQAMRVDPMVALRQE